MKIDEQAVRRLAGLITRFLDQGDNSAYDRLVYPGQPADGRENTDADHRRLMEAGFKVESWKLVEWSATEFEGSSVYRTYPTPIAALEMVLHNTEGETTKYYAPFVRLEDQYKLCYNVHREPGFFHEPRRSDSTRGRSNRHVGGPKRGTRQTKATREYRLTPEEAANLDTWHIINTVISRVADDAPENFRDSDAMEEFFEEVLPAQAAVFAARLSATYALEGGMWEIFEQCSAPMIQKVIEGYELLHEPKAAATLRKACACFPRGVVPRYHDEVLGFLARYDDWPSSIADLGKYFEDSQRVHAFFDFERFFRKHRESFVIPE